MDGFFLFLMLLQGVAIGWLCSYVAGQKNRGTTSWFFLGFFFSILALIALAAIPSVSAYTPQSYPDRSESDSSEIEKAIEKNDHVLVRNLLQRGVARPDGSSRLGRGWLQLATANGAFESVEVLLELGADAKRVDEQGKTVFSVLESYPDQRLKKLFDDKLNAKNKPRMAESRVSGKVDHLKELASLLERGHVTQQEFDSLKRQLIEAPS